MGAQDFVCLVTETSPERAFELAKEQAQIPGSGFELLASKKKFTPLRPDEVLYIDSAMMWAENLVKDQTTSGQFGKFSDSAGCIEVRPINPSETTCFPEGMHQYLFFGTAKV